jgi:hypothetical protein
MCFLKPKLPPARSRARVLGPFCSDVARNPCCCLSRIGSYFKSYPSQSTPCGLTLHDIVEQLSDRDQSNQYLAYAAQKARVCKPPQEAAMGGDGGGRSEGVATTKPGAAIEAALSVPKPALSMPTISSKDTPIRTWNTSKLGLRIGVDALSAGAAGALVAPIITMIDRGIIENASGRNTLKESLKASWREMLGRPGGFFGGRAFMLVFVSLVPNKTLSLCLHSFEC